MFLLDEHIPDDSNKLEVLYYKYAHSLWYIAMSYVKDEQLAEDLVHDTFLKLAKCPERVEKVEGNRTKIFLFTIIRHLSIDVIRQRKRRNEWLHEEYMDVRSDDPWNMPLERLVMNETMADVRRALKKLPDKYRAPMELRLIHDCTNVEIAKLLDLSPNLVGVQLMRGRRIIMKLLEEGTDEPK